LLNADGSSSSSAAAGAASKNPARSAKKNYDSFGTFIYRVLTQVSGPVGVDNKKIGITKISVDIVDTFLQEMLYRIVTEATSLARYNKRATISCREIQTAVALEFTDEITKHCVSEGTKAIAKATRSNAEAAVRAAGPDAKKKNGKEESQSKKAGLTFPVGRIKRHMKVMRCSARLTASAPIYLAAVLEYLCAEVLEIAVYETEKHKHLRITPRHLNDAIRADADLSVIVGASVTIPHAGVPSTFVRPPPKKSKKNKDVNADDAVADDLPEEEDVEGVDDDEESVSDEEEEAVVAAPPPKKKQAKKASSTNGNAAATAAPKKKAQTAAPVTAAAPSAADEEDSESQSGEE
jgi:histone H3/H4